MMATLGGADYAVFAATLVVSAGIGIFYAILEYRRKENISSEEYLMGGR